MIKKFVVERILPGAGQLSRDELKLISKSFCDVISQSGKQHHWIHSYVTADKIYCIHIAENEEVIREHSRMGKFPINTISEITAEIDPKSKTDNVE